MFSQTDWKIISHLRNNARKKVTEISREIEVPATTIYDKINSHERKGNFKRHVTLLDFQKLGFHATMVVAMKVDKERRCALQEFLEQHPSINTLYRTDFGNDYLAEIVCEDMSRFRELLDELDTKFGITDPQIFSIVHEIKKEQFLANSI